MISKNHSHTAGLVSVTFRKLAPADVVALSVQNCLGSIEWGGDIHVPEGDMTIAKEVGRLTKAEGLQVAAYGSYYRLGAGEKNSCSFSKILDTAVALGAPVIRVWAGEKGSETAGAQCWQQVCLDAFRAADLAAKAQVRVALEFHGGTLNDTPAAALRLWKDLDHPNLFSLWQPLPTLNATEQDESLQVILPRLSHIHVFHWLPGPPVLRRPLAEGAIEWNRWLSMIRRDQPDIRALLEFVTDDDPANLCEDARTLLNLMRQDV